MAEWLEGVLFNIRAELWVKLKVISTGSRRSPKLPNNRGQEQKLDLPESWDGILPCLAGLMYLCRKGQDSACTKSWCLSSQCYRQAVASVSPAFLLGLRCGATAATPTENLYISLMLSVSHSLNTDHFRSTPIDTGGTLRTIYN